MRISDWSSDVCSSDLGTIGGAPRWWELSASPRLDETGKFLGFRGVGSDVTEKRATAEQIAKMARYDNLTGLPNRLSLNEDLARALKHAVEAKSRCALLMIDLDRFRSEEHTSELQSLMRISYAVFCLKKKNKKQTDN